MPWQCNAVKHQENILYSLSSESSSSKKYPQFTSKNAADSHLSTGGL